MVKPFHESGKAMDLAAFAWYVGVLQCLMCREMELLEIARNRSKCKFQFLQKSHFFAKITILSKNHIFFKESQIS